MNKIRATKREMRNNYRILSVGYCDLQHLLSYESPISYSSGVYGWCCDYYYVDDVIISTGYSPIDNKNMKNDYKLIRKYNDKARSINDKNKLKKLLSKMINELKVYK
jgi:hypothetical protein